jgi:hypothetical protein
VTFFFFTGVTISPPTIIGFFPSSDCLPLDIADSPLNQAHSEGQFSVVIYYARREIV